MRKDPTEFRERFKKWQSGEKVYEAGLPKYEDGTEPNIFRRSDGTFFYKGGIKDIDVTPINTSIGDDPSQWTFLDSSGQIYTPHRDEPYTGTVVQDDRNVGKKFWDNYIGELKYDLKNDKVVTGKYTMPAIGMAALGGYLTNLAGGVGAAASTLSEMTALAGQNIWRDGLLKTGISMLSGKALDDATKIATGSSWGQNVNNLTGGYVPETIGDFTNPGYLFTGESVANKIANTDFSKTLKNGVRFVKKQLTAEARAKKLETDLEQHRKFINDKFLAEQNKLNIARENARKEHSEALDEQSTVSGQINRKLSDGSQGLKADAYVSDNDWITSFIMKAAAKRLRPAVKQIMKDRGLNPDLIKQDDQLIKILKQISEENNVDFSKMKSADVVRLIKKNLKRFVYDNELLRADENVPETHEGLIKILKNSGVLFDQDGRVLDSSDVIPFNKIFLTGQFKVPLFSGGNVEGLINVTNPGIQSSSVLGDIIKSISDPYKLIRRIETGSSKYESQIPKEYPEALRLNIKYLMEKFPGAKAFGSSTTSAYAGTPHVTHDIDLIISEDDFIKNVESVLGKRNGNGWSVTSKPNGTGYEDTFMHTVDPELGEAGNIDFNIIYTDPKTGMASSEKGTRAIELFRQFFPADYRRAVQESLRTGQPIQINKTPRELINAYDPVQKTILDALSSGKSKHVARAEAHLTTSDPQAVEKALDLYLQEKTGGLGQNIPVTKEMFNDVERNRRIFDDLGYKGVDKETVVNDPLKMKNLVTYWYIHNSVYGRGVTKGTLSAKQGVSEQELIDSSYRDWIGTGGNARGAGLNAVTLGDSSYGDIYGYILPRNKKFDSQNIAEFYDSDPEKIIKTAKAGLGHPSYRFDTTEKKLIKEILQQYGYDFDESIINSPEDLLSMLPSDISAKPVLQEISDRLGIRSLLRNERFGGGRYVSMTGRVNDQDAVMYDTRSKMEMPVSDLQRDATVAQNNVNSTNIIKTRLLDVGKNSSKKKIIQQIKRSGLVDSKLDLQARYEMYNYLRTKIITRQLDKRGITKRVQDAYKKYEAARNEADKNANATIDADASNYKRIGIANRAVHKAKENKYYTYSAGAVLGIPTAIISALSAYQKDRRIEYELEQKRRKSQTMKSDKNKL